MSGRNHRLISARERNDLLAAAITDARRQQDSARSRNPGFADEAEAGWRKRNPGLARLIDHAEGEQP